MIEDLPSNCSNREFTNHFQSVEGIRSIYFGHPLICPAKGLYRFAWITCENQEVCDKVLSLLSGDFNYIFNEYSKETRKTRLHARLQPSFKKQYFLPSLLNQESYIEEDYELCCQLLRALETYWVGFNAFIWFVGYWHLIQTLSSNALRKQPKDYQNRSSVSSCFLYPSCIWIWLLEEYKWWAFWY